MKTGLILAAAGASRRMGGSVPKQYMLCGGLPVLVRSLAPFLQSFSFGCVCLVCPPGDESHVKELLARYGLSVDAVVPGGTTRQESVYRALQALPPDTDTVLIHDGARPFVSARVIERVLLAAETHPAVIPGVTPKNTIRTRSCTLVRSELFEVQTPQAFDYGLLMQANRKALEDGFCATDDAGLVERLGIPVTIVAGEYANLKITTPEDLPMTMRTGMGYDVHRLVEGRPLMLGCVHIPCEKGLLGHSDADVLSHAVCDALLGACALGDIGRHFPDKDPQYEGMSGTEILSKTAGIIRNSGFTINNIDATLVAERPKIAPYAPQMICAVAEALGVPQSAVSIKATTEEGLGISGGGEAMSAYAVATVFSR